MRFTPSISRASLAAGIGFSKLVEIPALRLREKLFPSDGGIVEVKITRPAARPEVLTT